MTISPIAGLLSSFSSSSGSSIFGTLANAPSTAQFDSILKNQEVQLTKNRIFNGAAQRLQYIQDGSLSPSADWEQVGGYLAATGEPFVVTLDDKGAVQITRQSESDLSRFNVQQQKRLAEAFGELAELNGKVQANAKNQKLVNSLEGAGVVLEGIREGQLEPQSEWEMAARRLATTGSPFKIVLNSKGELSVLDQTTTALPDVPAYQQPMLRTAVSQLQQAQRQGYGTTVWQNEALSLSERGIGFFLDIDPTTNEILVKANTASNVVPDFLKQAPYPDLKLDSQWKRDAASLIQEGKGFYLDFDTTGQIVAKENTGPNIIKYNQPKNEQPASAALLISMLA